MDSSMTNNGHDEDHFIWWNSSMFEDLISGILYRGWIRSRYDYMLEGQEVFTISKEIERKLETNVEYYEPRVPNCREI
jgi:hypothetical protein